MEYISAEQVGKILFEQNITDYRNLKLNDAEIVKISDSELLGIGDITVNEFAKFDE